MMRETYMNPRPLPGWLFSIYPKRQASVGDQSHPYIPDDVIPEGQRDATLTRMAGGMRRQGMTAEEMVPSLLVVNAGRCNPPMSDEQVRKIAHSMARYDPERRRNVDRVTVSVF